MPTAAAASGPAPRYELSAYVDFKGRRHKSAHRVQNMSMGGVCVHVPEVQRPGQRVHLVISIPELSAQLEVEGEVIWSRADTRDMGIRFDDLDQERAALLKGYLEAVGRLRQPSGPS